jgi:HSP20 family protein
MSIVRWDPWREIEDMAERYTRAVGQPRVGSQEGFAAVYWALRVDIIETEKAFVSKAEIPEVNKEDVRVTVDNGLLTIQGE